MAQPAESRDQLPARGRRTGIATRLMIGHTILLLVVIGAVAFQSARIFSNRAQQALNTDLTEEVPEFNNAADHRPANQSLEAFTVSYLQTHLRPQGLELVVALRGAPGSGGVAAPSTVFTTAGAQQLRQAPQVINWLANPPVATTITDVTVRDVHMRVLAAPIVRSGHDVGTLIAASDLTALNSDLRTQLLLVGGEGAAALLAAVFGGYLLIRRVLKVITKVTDTAEEIASGDLSRRLHVEGPDDEVGRLARTVDRMLDRLEASFNAQSELLADVSHQLRTPLTVIRGHLDVLNRGAMADPDDAAASVALVIDELDQLALMVDRMLLLGQALERDFLMEEAISLPVLLAEVFDASRFLAERDWQLGDVPDVVITGDRIKLRGALLNLVDNAVKATSPGDVIGLRASLVDDEIIIEVRDAGRGMDAAEREVVLGRFARSRSAHYRGSGLGLAIVKAVVEAHGGSVRLDSAPGAGSTVQLRLPAARLQSRLAPAVP